VIVHVVWIAFAIMVTLSFIRLGVAELLRGRPHVASMAASYCLLVLSLVEGGDPQQDYRCYWLVVALCLGIVGLVNYWVRYFREDA